MLNLFGIDVNKIIIYIVGAVLAIAVVTGAYFYWKHSIKKQAQLEFDNKQLEQVVKDQKQTLDQLLKINKNQEDIIAGLNKQNDDLKNKLSYLDGYLNNMRQLTISNIREYHRYNDLNYGYTFNIFNYIFIIT